MRRLSRWLLRIIVSAAMLAVVFSFLPLGEVWEAMQRVPSGIWLAVLAGFLSVHALSAIKWWLLIDQTEVTAWWFLRAHYVGLMGNLCLPGVVGGDIVRCGCLSGRGIPMAKLGVACITDRVLDTLALLTLAIAGGIACDAYKEIAQAAQVVGLCLALGVVAVGAILVLGIHRKPSGPRLRSLMEALEEMVTRPWTLLRSFLIAMFVQSCFVGLSVALGWHTGVNVGLPAWFLAWPLAKLAALFPITLAGLGVRESALVVLLEPFGSSAAAVTAASLVWQTILFAGGLVGGLIALNGTSARITSRQAPAS